jgi:iron complex outermembrane receptor protein
MLSQEFRLAWDTGGDFSWIVGASYAKDELEESTSLTGETGLLPLAFGGLTVAEQPYTQETEAWAVYGHAEWQLTANVDVILEGRYTHEDKSLDGGVFLPQAGFFLTYADDSESYAGATGKLAVEWSVTDAAMLYASLAHGFKSGGFFGGFATSNEQLEPFDEETILAYELGFKSDFPEARARLNGAVYYYDRSDIQASGYDTTGTIGIQRLTNVGDGEVYGAELEAIWSPTDQLRLQAGLAYVHSEIVDSDKTTADVFASTTTAPYEGATLPNQPEFSASLLAGYDVALSTDWTLGIELEYLYRSEQDLRIVVLPEERGIAEEDAYGLTNLRLTLSQTSGGISLAAFCNNVFGEEYRTVLTKDDLGGVYEIYGDPLTWGLTLRYEF